MYSSKLGATLYYASTQTPLQNAYSDRTELNIYVIDGQNETEIMNHIIMNDTDNYNPCLPILFTAEQDITITFDADNINDFSDWYPKELCENQTYINEYMFDGFGTIEFTNLIISDQYIHNDSYSLIRTTEDNFNGTIKCIDCTFRNITSEGISIIITYSNIFLVNNEFSNIELMGNPSICFYCQETPAVIYADYIYEYNEYTPRLITIQQSLFTNISVYTSLVNILWNERDVVKYFHLSPRHDWCQSF